MKSALLAASFALAAFAALPASATIVMVDASTIQGNNLLFNLGVQTGATVTGHTQSGTLVDFTGTSNAGTTIRANGGQARVEGVINTNTPNPNDTFTLDSLAFELANGNTFNNLEFNLFGGDATAANFTLVDNTGQTFTFLNNALSNGQNFFGFQGLNGESIRNITIALSGGGVNDVRQIRLDEVLATGAVPEPAGWALMIIGLGCVGGMMRRRRTGPVSAIA